MLINCTGHDFLHYVQLDGAIKMQALTTSQRITTYALFNGPIDWWRVFMARSIDLSGLLAGDNKVYFLLSDSSD